MKFVGDRACKQDAVHYLNEGNAMVGMKRKKPIARLTPGQPGVDENGRLIAQCRKRPFNLFF